MRLFLGFFICLSSYTICFCMYYTPTRLINSSFNPRSYIATSSQRFSTKTRTKGSPCASACFKASIKWLLETGHGIGYVLYAMRTRSPNNHSNTPISRLRITCFKTRPERECIVSSSIYAVQDSRVSISSLSSDQGGRRSLSGMRVVDDE